MQLEQLRQAVYRHLDQQYGDQCAWTISDQTVAGRGLVATRDISPGEVVFADHPLVRGPRSGSLSEQGCTVCRNVCYKYIKCSRCALLVCSVSCQASDIHYKDCSVVSRWTCLGPLEEVDDLVMIRALSPIRSLQLSSEQTELLKLMQANALPQHAFEVRALKEYFELPEDDEEMMTLACYVLDANAFQIASPYGAHVMSMRGLYPLAGLLNHACVPNVRHTFDRRDAMTVKAATYIQAGEEIVSCYSGLLWGTPARRHHLYKTKHFLCMCPRCADPTEFGTNLAALKCFSPDCTGFLLPSKPLNTTSSWQCGSCSIVVPCKYIGAIQSALGSLMGTLDTEDPMQLEKFALQRLFRYIPRSNQINVDVQCRLIWLYGETPGNIWTELSDSRLQLKESLCRTVLDAVRRLRAGDAHLRGLLLYHLHATLAERARRHPAIYEELKTEIESTIEEAFRILEGDISAPQDLQLRRQYLGPSCDKPTSERLRFLQP